MADDPAARADAFLVPETFPEAMVAAAFICERFLLDQDQLGSFIRIVDNFSFHTSGAPVIGESQNVPEEELRASLLEVARASSAETKVYIVVMIRGLAETQHRLDLVYRGAAGARLYVGGAQLAIGANNKGGSQGTSTYVSEVGVVPSLGPGEHWFEIFLNGSYASRMPFSISQTIEVLEAGQLG